MTYDWLTAPPDARRELYRSCKRIVDGYFVGDWGKFYAAAFDGGSAFGDGYEDNFRKGLIARTKATALARWLSIHHTREAELLAQRVGALTGTTPSDWEAFIADIAGEDGLAIMRLADLGIVGFASAESPSMPRLRLGEAFCLKLDTPIAGYAFAVQRVRGQWYALPLSDERIDVAIPEGETLLPRAAVSGEVLPLSDDIDGGRVLFVVLVAHAEIIAPLASSLSGGQAIPPAVLDRIAATVGRASPSAAFYTEVLIS